MTGPELDALIARVEYRVGRGFTTHSEDALALVSELKIYRAMSLRLERCVHELVKEGGGMTHDELILAHDEEIRREERNKAKEIVCAYWPDEEFIKIAIMGKG
jgi:hypothetical protein